MKEILLRWRGPLNTFWRNGIYIFSVIGGIAISITDLLPEMLNNDLVPENWKTYLRVLYGICLGFSLAAKLTVREPQQLKHKVEFDDKLDNPSPPAPGVYNPEQIQP